MYINFSSISILETHKYLFFKNALQMSQHIHNLKIQISNDRDSR